MKLIFNPRSFPLNPDANCQPYLRLAKFEVSLQTRGCSRNCFAQQCSSLSLVLAKLSVKEPSEARRNCSQRVLPSIFVIPSLTPFHETLSALVVGRVLTRASAISWNCGQPFLTLNLLSDLYLSVDSQVSRALGCSDACYSCGSSRHSTSGCQEKQTPVPLPVAGKRSKYCNSRSNSLSSCCSVPPWSVTLFYIKRSCLVS